MAPEVTLDAGPEARLVHSYLPEASDGTSWVPNDKVITGS